MSTLVTRAGKGSPLTHNEVDTNFTNLNTDKVEKTSADITGGTINGTTVGATTPAAGTFTTLTATGQTSLGGVAGSESLRVLTAGASPNAYATVQGSSFSTAYFGFGGSATNGNLYFQSKAAGTITFQTNNGSQTQLNVSHTASAVNYHQLTGSATGSGPIHSVAGSDTNIDLNLTTKGTGAVRFNTGGGLGFRVSEAFLTGTAVNYIDASGRQTGLGPVLSVNGSDTNVRFNITSKGSEAVGIYTNLANQLQFNVAHTASAVNYVQVTGNTTGNRPYFITGGSDTNISFAYSAKGTGAHDFYTNGFSFAQQFRIAHTASTVNYLQVTGSATGNAVQVLAVGTDTNIPLVLQPKGTGALQAQQTDSTATGGNARGANAVDWQTTRSAASAVAGGAYAVVGGGGGNGATGTYTTVAGGAGNFATGFGSSVVGGNGNVCSATYAFLGAGQSNTVSGYLSAVCTGISNTAAGVYNFIGGGFTNSATSNSAVTTQSGTMNGTTAVTLSGSNASIKVGQYIAGTSIAAETYVAAISGTSLTLSKVASGSSTSTLSFFTPHGIVVGGGNNTATGSYSFIGGGGDAGTAGNRNVASGDWSFVGGGKKNVASGVGSTVAGGGTDGANTFSNTASGITSFVGGGWNNTAGGTLSVVVGGTSNNASGFDAFIGGGDNHTGSGLTSAIMGGRRGTTRGLTGYHAFPACYEPLGSTTGAAQAALLILAVQTTDATATVLRSDPNAASTTNQVILPNNSAYFFTGEVVAGVTGGGNTKGWTIEGVIKRGANAASTALVGTPTVTSTYADAGASTWTIAVTADTTNGGLAVTFTGQASTTIRTVCQIRTTEMTY
jgi:hypothetical protein